ncbi:hypothetical protein [Paenisporosarcina sp. TG20]|uniref:hypothetical protein n=1 Tax=Paenisporosarcina sp. TG20 TaxID=1211706 RepID=UPI00031CF36C|nr:hypothetical protein [Paenisporosarcina sp. TG20]
MDLKEVAYKIDLSLATIGRHLKDFDQQKLTQLIPLQGREITLLGKNYISETEREIERFEIESIVMLVSNH